MRHKTQYIFWPLLTGGLILTIILASWSAGRLARFKTNDGCSSSVQTFTITIVHDEATPASIRAHYCDKLVIRNLDPTGRLMAFGEHDNHQPYDGVTERFLQPGESFSVRLRQTGIFLVHDHLHDRVRAIFIVTRL